jgi:glucokinase
VTVFSSPGIVTGQAAGPDSASAGDGHAPADRPLLVGVDVGGSKIAVLVVDRAMTVCARHTVPTSVGAPDEAAEHIATAIASALELAGASMAEVAAVGVGVPGRVDTVDGHVSLAVNLGWRSLPLRQRLEERLGVPCGIENDVRAATSGIHERRLLGEIDDFVYLSVGTGISAGVVIDGTLHRGTRGLAGEIGHTVVDVNGPVCPCGLRGCLETIAAGPFVARAATAAIAAGEPSSLADAGAGLDAVQVYAAAAAGDPLAVAITTAAGRALARAIHALVMTYDIERVVLGGGVSRAGAVFLDPIQAELASMRRASELAAELLPPDVVRILPDGAEAGAWGGVSVARTLVEEVVTREVTA